MRSIHGIIAATGVKQEITLNYDTVAGPISAQIYCSWATLQDKGSNNMYVGDNTIAGTGGSDLTATTGIVIYPGGGAETIAPVCVRGTPLWTYYVIGTIGDHYEVMYEPSN